MSDGQIDIDTSTVTPAGSEPLAPVRQEAEAPADIDSIISKAIDGSSSDDAPQSDGRPRDEHGRFTAKAAAPQPEGTEPAAEVQPVTEDKPKDSPTEGHFRGWSQDEREKFGKLPPEAQSFVLERQKALQGAMTRQTQEFKAQLQQLDPYANVIRTKSDYLDTVSHQLGIPTHEVVANVLATEEALRFGTYSEKVQMLHALAQSYGVRLDTQPDQMAEPGRAPDDAYPVVHDLRQHISKLEGKLSAIERQSQATEAQRLSAEIDRFKSATGADGAPQYPLFEMVKGSMAQILEDRKATTLAEAYALAVKPIEDAKAAEIKRIREESARSVAKAKSAAPVKYSGMAPGGATKAQSLDELLSDTLTNAGW